MGRTKGNRTVTLDLLVPDGLKKSICRTFGPRKFAWILEKVNEAGQSGDYRALVYDLEIARIEQARALWDARARLLALLRERQCLGEASCGSTSTA